MHIFMGLVVAGLAICLVGIGIVVGPKIWRMRPAPGGRFAFVLMMISLAAYLFWIAALFFADALGDENYAPVLIAVRLLAFIGAAVFLFSMWRCDPRAYLFLPPENEDEADPPGD